MMVLHPLFSYPTIILALLVFTLYTLALLKFKSFLKPALIANAALIVFALLSVLFGFGLSSVPLVQSKVPFIWGFPHKWNGILILVLSVMTFALFLFRGDRLGKKFIVLPIIGLLITTFQLFTGWMLRLVFFS
ncbi:MAG: hypothetical protein NZ526_06985 [Aquificaceae bacterium]|nr:hypothetical protein [Aquificaceae bacterium]MCS7308275.1 hypothetical protein [Aquificaceae bacterium]MDW8433416.1 hypothetical protein [Aquificaceae bacterium]